MTKNLRIINWTAMITNGSEDEKEWVNRKREDLSDTEDIQASSDQGYFEGGQEQLGYFN